MDDRRDIENAGMIGDEDIRRLSQAVHAVRPQTDPVGFKEQMNPEALQNGEPPGVGIEEADCAGRSSKNEGIDCG